MFIFLYLLVLTPIFYGGLRIIKFFVQQKIKVIHLTNPPFLYCSNTKEIENIVKNEIPTDIVFSNENDYEEYKNELKKNKYSLQFFKIKGNSFEQAGLDEGDLVGVEMIPQNAIQNYVKEDLKKEDKIILTFERNRLIGYKLRIFDKYDESTKRINVKYFYMNNKGHRELRNMDSTYDLNRCIGVVKIHIK